MNETLLERYKPNNADEYLFPSGVEGKSLRKLLTMKKPQHLILHGTPGTGKTSFVEVLANTFGVDPVDIIHRRGSELTSSGDMQDKIFPLLQTIPWGSPFKILHIDECDHFNPRATTDMKAILENYPVVVVIMTTNNVDRMDAAILSRCLTVKIKHTRKNLAIWAEQILAKERVKYCPKLLASMLRAITPDLRSMTNMLELNFL